jgi:hypothetical protein
MLKSRYSDPNVQDHGFVNHIAHVVRDMGVYPGTTNPLIECYKVELIQNLGATSGTGAKPRNIALFRKALGPGQDPSTGTWQLIKMWSEKLDANAPGDYDDASAAGSVDIHPHTGDVHVVLSFGKRNAAGAMTYQPWEALIQRATFAPSIVRLPTQAGPAGPQGPQGVPGPSGPQGPAGNGSSALTPAQQLVLDYLVSVYGPLLAR